MEPSHEGRRSTRIRAQIPLRITSLDSASPFSEHCHTLVLNVQGCGIRLARRLQPGMPVWIDELPNGASATARVANCIPLGAEGEFWLIGLALDEPGNIWGLNPVPADWAKLLKWPRRQHPRRDSRPNQMNGHIAASLPAANSIAEENRYLLVQQIRHVPLVIIRRGVLHKIQHAMHFGAVFAAHFGELDRKSCARIDPHHFAFGVQAAIID
jgi:hypothetical protein